MQTQDIKPDLIGQIETFLTFTADTDNDTIVTQYTIIKSLIDQIAIEDHPTVNSFEKSLNEDRNDDYRYFLDLNTLSPQPIVRKAHALDGLQERFRRLLKQLTP